MSTPAPDPPRSIAIRRSMRSITKPASYAVSAKSYSLSPSPSPVTSTSSLDPQSSSTTPPPSADIPPKRKRAVAKTLARKAGKRRKTTGAGAPSGESEKTKPEDGDKVKEEPAGEFDQSPPLGEMLTARNQRQGEIQGPTAQRPVTDNYSPSETQGEQAQQKPGKQLIVENHSLPAEQAQQKPGEQHLVKNHNPPREGVQQKPGEQPVKDNHSPFGAQNHQAQQRPEKQPLAENNNPPEEKLDPAQSYVPEKEKFQSPPGVLPSIEQPAVTPQPRDPPGGPPSGNPSTRTSEKNHISTEVKASPPPEVLVNNSTTNTSSESEPPRRRSRRLKTALPPTATASTTATPTKRRRTGSAKLKAKDTSLPKESSISVSASEEILAPPNPSPAPIAMPELSAVTQSEQSISTLISSLTTSPYAQLLLKLLNNAMEHYAMIRHESNPMAQYLDDNHRAWQTFIPTAAFGVGVGELRESVRENMGKEGDKKQKEADVDVAAAAKQLCRRLWRNIVYTNGEVELEVFLEKLRSGQEEAEKEEERKKAEKREAERREMENETNEAKYEVKEAKEDSGGEPKVQLSRRGAAAKARKRFKGRFVAGG